MPNLPETSERKSRQAPKSPIPKKGIRKSAHRRGMAPMIDVEEKPQRNPLPGNEKNSLDLPNVLVIRKTSSGYEGKLEVSNVSYPFGNHYMCYRVRASVPDRYRISHTMGCIQSGTHVSISISTEPKLKNTLTFDQIKEDYFEIDAAPMPIKSATQSSLFSFWKKNADGKKVERYRVEHIFLLGVLGLDKDYSALNAVQELAFSDVELELMKEMAALKKSCEDIHPKEDMTPFVKLTAWIEIMLEDGCGAIPTGRRMAFIALLFLVTFIFIVGGVVAQYCLS